MRWNISLIFLIPFLASCVARVKDPSVESGASQYVGCEVALKDQAIENGQLIVTVHSTCFLAATPYVVIRDDASGHVVAQGKREPYGHLPNTSKTYLVPLHGLSIDLSKVSLLLVSNMGKQQNLIERELR